ncbi:MAG TPA: Gfo/Idh/MocA family oxidoreductase, partial [Chloroflexota bacterium]|nr:Gfo/Idh/MocA family oxidoreductase [Chloroflexota bacterium]
TTDKIRLGIIGCGGIARGRHLTGLALLKKAGLENFRVTALCDTSAENLDTAADYVRRELGGEPERYADWQELVAKGAVDAVDVCLPHGLHHVVGIAALGAGLHVVMEKPYTVSVETGRRLAAAADTSGKVLATAVPHRRTPGQRAVHWAINEGRLIGQPRMFFAHYTQWRDQPRSTPDANLPPAVAWRRDRLMGGGAGVMDSGFHFLDSIQYFYGQPLQVYAELRAFAPGGADQPPVSGKGIVDEREDTAVVTFSFQNGVVGTWCWSFQVAGKETRNCVIYGSEGSIEDTGYSNRFVVYHQFEHNIFEFRGKDGSFLSMSEIHSRMRRELGPERMNELYPNGVTDHFAIELWDFLKAVQTGGKPEVDGWGGLATTALVEAIYESAYSGQAVKVADVLQGKSGPAYHGWQTDIDAHWESQSVPHLRRA